MTFTLRDYQTDLIEQARSQIRTGRQAVLMVAPTGAGKTALAAFMLGTAAERGRRCWFNVHRRELVTQSSRTFDKVGIDHGIIAAGFTANPRARVQIAGIQTLARRLDQVAPPNMIVWDECHHIASDSWASIFSRYPDAVHIGLTATPCRLDGRGLGDWFGAMVEGPTTRLLIDQGFLSPYKIYAPSTPDMSGVHTRGGDFIGTEAADRMDKPSITGDAIAHYRKLADGKRAIVFAANIEHSRHVVAQFNAAGYAAAHVDGTTDRPVRDGILRDFEAGRIKIVSNVDLFGEGFDAPAIEAVILLRPTQSTSLYLQMVGRGLRTAEGKTHAVILDHAGNALRHGMPDEIREWNLDPKAKAKRNRDDVPPIKQCPSCYAVHPPAPQCPSCRHEYEIKARALEQRDGELIELSEEVMRRTKRKEQGQAQTLDDLISLANSRGYKNPVAWARHIHGARKHRFG